MSGQDDDKPSKSDLNTVFKKLRSAPANKVCFDCGTSLPSWASVTYGVFICIDCSAIHRGLGVHLSFVRSTQLDTNWTWLQLRAMQVGGNANATEFFRQHGCTSTDAQQKYKSRAAQLYREKLHHMAVAAMRLHGYKLHIDSHESQSPPATEKNVDFFETISQQATIIQSPSSSSLVDQAFISKPSNIPENGPSVDHILGSTPPKDPQPSAAPMIGQRKPQQKKGMLGKKGLGGQKVSADFEELEKKAESLAKAKEESGYPKAFVTADEESEIPKLSSKLMVQNITQERDKQEQKFKAVDPNKGEQVERLGMGLPGVRSGVSHSVFSDMKTIKQEGSSNFGGTKTVTTRQPDPEDDWVILQPEKKFGSNQDDDLFSAKIKSEQDEFFDALEDSETSKSRANVVRSSAPDSREAQSKFGNAKAISSDQFFGGTGRDFENNVSISRFEGSTSISSSDYFGGGDDRRRTSNPGYSYGSYASYAVPDMSDIKDSVRTGVTKVAGKLSQLSSSVQTYIAGKSN